MRHSYLLSAVAILAASIGGLAQSVRFSETPLAGPQMSLSLATFMLQEPASAGSNVVQASNYPGADCGAKVNAADASLGTVAGEIDVDKNCGTEWATPISLSQSHSLRIDQPGVYSIPSGNTLAGGNTLFGSGESTVLQLAQGASAGSAFTVMGDNVVFQSLKLDGNSANETNKQTAILVVAGVANFRLSQVALTHWNSLALTANGTGARPVANLSIENSSFDGSGSDMVFLNDVDVATISGSRFAHCGVSSQDCVGWEMTATRKQISFVNDSCLGSGTGHCFTQGPFHPSLTYANCIITGNHFDSADGNAGISPQCSSGTISRNAFVDGPATGGSWRNGIEFYGSNTRIAGNVITNGSILIGPPFDVPSSDISVTGNTIRNVGSSSNGCIQIGGGPGVSPAMDSIRIQGNHCDLTGLTSTAVGIGNLSSPAQKYTNLVIDQNTIEGDPNVRAIQLSPTATGSAGWQITNNKIHNASVGLRLANGANIGDVTFAGNDLAGTTTPSSVSGSPGAMHRCGNSLSPTQLESGTSCLTGATGTIGGIFLATGQCATGAATVNGAAVGMAATARERGGTFVGSSFRIRASVDAPNTVTVNVCAVSSGTPTAAMYSVQVVPE
jgi:hypothetical protein